MDRFEREIDSIIHQAPHVSEGEIWWASIGENVGAEINGKSQDFSRPIVIFRKLAHGFYFVVPLTTQIRNGSWYVNFMEKIKWFVLAYTKFVRLIIED